ncbi:hypothetical protein [Aurantimonas marina]|uniref:hypothetical protein n=1 Tax=Aurantimonas marina TaxID=2780508 RepID=UPI0019D2FD14|nr:hypothetical protein [Aurantimonas marina]
MAEINLQSLLVRCATTSEVDLDLVTDIRHALEEHVPAVAAPADALASTDGALALAAQALPGWAVTLRGSTRPGSQWSCVLKEDESQDDDQTMAAGRGASPAVAISAAVLQVISGYEKGFQ